MFLACALVLLSRVGFLSAVAMMFGYMTLTSVALTLHPQAWFLTSSLVVLLVFALLAFGAYATSQRASGARSS